jgi:mono/diheme cytochrome c family protein
VRIAWTLTVVVAAACGDGSDRAAGGAPAAAPPLFGEARAPATPAEEARQIWQTSCAGCHGPRGRGDGAVAASLAVRPRDHSDPAWQAATSDAAIADVIVRGGAAVGRSPAMPARPDLADRRDVVDELVAMIRGFGAR